MLGQAGLGRIGLGRLGVVIGVLYWPFEALVHAVIFGQGDFVGKLFPPEPNELWMRSVISIGFIAFGMSAQRMLDRQHLLQERLQQRKDRLQQVIDSAYDAYVSMDESGRITGWNRSAEELFGWPMQDVLGRLLSDTIVPPSQRQAHKRGMEKYLESSVGPWLYRPIRTTALRKDGSEVYIEMAVMPIRQEAEQEFFAFIRECSPETESSASA